MQNKEKNQNEYIDLCEVLVKIDDQLEAIDECSNEDFLELNRRFKSFHKQSVNLNQFIHELLDSLKKEANKDIYDQYTLLINHWQNYFTSQKKSLYSLNEMLNSINYEFEQLFIPLNNLRQNLLTLKLLITNLKVGSAYGRVHAKFSSKNIDEAIKKLISIHKEINTTYDNLFKELSTSKIQTENLYHSISEYEQESVYHLQDCLNH